jgi:TolB-like protein
VDKPSPAYSGDQPYVFVSYSHLDEKLVFAEIRWLQDQGIHVYYDEGIAPGSEWSDALAGAIKNCRQFVYFITPRSVDSENCRRELNFAIAENRQVLAVHLRETVVPDGIRLNLDNRQAVHKFNQSNEDYQRKLVAALTESSSRTPPVPARKSGVRRVFGLAALASAAAVLGGWVLFSLIEARDPVSVDEKSIVVLPFENLSPHPDNGYLADGLSEELIVGLAKVKGLRVAGRTSSFYYKTQPADLMTIGDRLHVNYAVEGSVRWDGDDIRVVARLLQISDGRELASLVLDRKAGQMLQLQGEIASAVVESLGLYLSDTEIRLATQPGTDDVAAFNLFLKGKTTASLGDFISAQNYYQAAIERDPLFFRAYTELAFNYYLESLFTDDPEGGYRRQMQVLKRVNELDPEGTRPTLLRDQDVYYMINREYAEAEQIERAMITGGEELWFAQASYGVNLARAGLFDAAADYARLPLVDDPLFIGYGGQSLTAAGQYTQALEELTRCLAIVPNNPACLLWKSRVLARTGNLPAALEMVAGSALENSAIQCLLRGDAGDPCDIPEYGSFAGKFLESRMLDATLAAYAGDLERAFGILEAEAARPHGMIDYLRVYASFWPESVRQHSRYVSVLERLNLGESWQQEFCKRAQKLTPVTRIEVRC